MPNYKSVGNSDRAADNGQSYCPTNTESNCKTNADTANFSAFVSAFETTNYAAVDADIAAFVKAFNTNVATNAKTVNTDQSAITTAVFAPEQTTYLATHIAARFEPHLAALQTADLFANFATVVQPYHAANKAANLASELSTE